MPAPQPPEQVPGKGRVVFFNVVSICAGVSAVGEALIINAATPATCGVAIEVPS